MASAKRCGLMELSLKETTLMAKNKEREYLPGLTEVHTREIFMRTTYTVGAYTAGLMGGFIMGRGSAIKCMGMVCLLGLMGGSMKGNMSMTRNKVKECFSGLTEESILEDGSMGSSMGKGFTYHRMEVKGRVSGMLGRESGGLETE